MSSPDQFKCKITFVIELKIVLLIGIVGGLGWFVRPLFALPAPTTFRECWAIFLAGLAMVVVSLCGALLAGSLSTMAIWILLCLAIALFKQRFRFEYIASPLAIRYIGFVLLIALLTSALYRTVPPFESAVMSQDSAIYIGAAYQTNKTGSHTYVDGVLQQMDEWERDLFTRNTIARDWTGPRIRFPGGVPVIDLKSSHVGFSLSHLISAWLAVGMKLFGDGFLAILSFLFAIGLIGVAMTAQSLAGNLSAIVTPVFFFCFYLQQYFSRSPLSEALSQGLFVVGLSLFARSLQRPELPSSGEQLLIGLLWTGFVWSRIDALFLMNLSLLVAFVLIPALRRQLYSWRVMLLTLIAGSVLSLLYLSICGTYLYLFSERAFFGTKSYWLVGVMSEIVEASWKYPFLCTAVSSVAITVFVILAYRARRKSWFWKWGPVCLFALTLAMPVMLSTTAPPSTSLQDRIGWFLLYLQVPVLVFVAAGLVASIVSIRQDSRLYGSLLLLMLIPAAFFLFRPLVQHVQPLAMRRFFPMVLPLLLLLSVCGFRQFVRHFFPEIWLSRFLFVSLSAVVSVILLRTGTWELLQPIQTGVLYQTKNIGSELPPESLIVIPESQAGFQLEIPLQYQVGKSCIVLPLSFGRIGKHLPVVDGYLRKRIDAGVPVYAMAIENQLAIGSLWRFFTPTLAGSGVLEFSSPGTAGLSEFPKGIQQNHVSYSFYKITNGSAPLRNRIDYNDTNAVFLNFHEPEAAGFRWTRASSTICGFEYKTDGKVELRLQIGPVGKSHAAPSITVNESTPATFAHADSDALVYEISGVSSIRTVTIDSPVFTPGTQDPRDLGFCFISLSFD